MVAKLDLTTARALRSLDVIGGVKIIGVIELAVIPARLREL